MRFLAADGVAVRLELVVVTDTVFEVVDLFIVTMDGPLVVLVDVVLDAVAGLVVMGVVDAGEEDELVGDVV